MNLLYIVFDIGLSGREELKEEGRKGFEFGKDLRQGESREAKGSCSFLNLTLGSIYFTHLSEPRFSGRMREDEWKTRTGVFCL